MNGLLKNLSEEHALEMFKGYRQYALQDLLKINPDCQEGPVHPWTRVFPYDAASEKWLRFTSKPMEERFPEHPFQEGLEPGKNAMWDFIRAYGLPEHRQSDSISPEWRGRIRPVRDGGGVWETVLRIAYHRNDPSLSCGAMIDLRSESYGKRLVEAAHAITHKRCISDLVATCDRAALHGLLREEFLRTVAEMWLSIEFKLPFSVLRDGKAPIMAYGVMVCPSISIGFGADQPLLRMPVLSNPSIIADKVLCCALVAIEVGYDPARTINMFAKDKPDSDWWSYQPVKMFFAGWETPAWMAGRPLVYPDTNFRRRVGHKADYACMASDLLSPELFNAHVTLGKKLMPTDGEKDLTKWLESDECSRLIRSRPPLPCPACLAVQPEIEAGVRPPKGAKPMKVKHIDDSWSRYFKRFKLACKYITAAKKKLSHNPKMWRYDAAEGRRIEKDLVKKLRKSSKKKKW